MLQTVIGDLTLAKDTYLCHQCNCVTNRSAHLARAVFNAFPYADVYSERTEHSKPGTIELRGNGDDQRWVVALYGQYYPGKTKYPNSPKDGWGARLGYFKSCLEELDKLPPGSFAFPWRLGCGAAGGNWDDYLALVQEFAKNHSVTLYRLTPPKPQLVPTNKLF